MNSRFPRVGIIGAGPIARMLVAPATALGIDLLLFAQTANDSGAQITNHIVGDFTNLSVLKEFAKECDLITVAHDLVPISVIKGLEAAGVRVYPSSTLLSLLQEKGSIGNKLSNTFSPTPATTSSNFEVSVIVARSPHGQATSWAPTQSVEEENTSIFTISPAPSISPELGERLQQRALEIAQDVSLIGVAAIEMVVAGEHLHITKISAGLHYSGYWTIDGARTSQFEQHLRAILDLPLGDPSMSADFAVMGNILGGEKTDMYRPYLHLMARNPDLKFHQYKNEVLIGSTIGHVTAVGSELSQLISNVQHARDYMNGSIDE